jgi:parvulin-like peptidyl-prolyl isomerase
MRARKGVLGGLAGFAALAVLAGRLAAQAPAPAPAQVPIPAPKQGDVKPAAVVNGEAIPMADVVTVLGQMPPPATPQTEAQKREQELSAVQVLVEQALMRQFLKNKVAAPAPAAIDKEVADLKEALKKEKTPLTLEQFLKETGQTEAQLRTDIATQLQWKAYVLPQLTEAALKIYYDTNKPLFDKVFVRASHILIRLAPNASQAERQAAKIKLGTLRQEILAGKIDFADAARKHSDCPSKANGGDIGPFPYKFAVLEPFAKAAFAMKVGDISDVVATDFGLHLIKVTNRDNGQPSDFAKIKDQVKEIYARELYQGIVLEQRRAARIEIFFPPSK